MLSRPDHSVFLGSSEMSHCVKLVDKNMHWEDRGMDVWDYGNGCVGLWEWIHVNMIIMIIYMTFEGTSYWLNKVRFVFTHTSPEPPGAE